MLIDLSPWEDPQWTRDMDARYSDFAEKIEFLLWWNGPGLPE